MSHLETRHVIIRGQVYRWEEKAPYTQSGESILGALEYDRKADKVKCHECGKWLTSLGPHVAIGHRETGLRNYKLTHGLIANVSLNAADEHAKRAAKFRATSLPAMRAGLEKYKAAVAAGERQPRLRRRRLGQTYATWRNEQNTCGEQIIFSLQNLITDSGRIPDFHEVPSKLRRQIQFHCGNYPSALAVLGLEPNKPLYTKELLIESLRDFYVLNRRMPRTREWGKGRLATAKTYCNHFWTMNNAYDAAGLGIVARQQTADERRAKLPKEVDREAISAVQKAVWAKRTPEERAEKMRSMNAAKLSRMTPEERSAMIAPARAKQTPDQLRQRWHDRWASMTPQERADRVRRLNEGRKHQRNAKLTAA
jgi:hypothetical protein